MSPRLVAVLSKKGEDATETALIMLKTMTLKKVKAYRIATHEMIRTAKTLRNLHTSSIDSHIVIGCVFSRTLDKDKLQPTTAKKATMLFDGRMHPPTINMPEAETIIKETEGDFAFVIAESERILAGRDPIGTRPLYYGENPDTIALASERKALWKIGIESTASFPPGHFALVDKRGFKSKPVRRLLYSKPKQTTMKAAAEKLCTLLQQSIKNSILDLKEVAVAFSGGLDSSLIAFLAKSAGIKVSLIHVTMENQLETEHAKRVADELKLPIHIYDYREEDVELILPKILWTIEEADPINVSIGIPIYWTAEKAAEKGFRVMLAGQGADELFGGYKRYVDCYALHGEEKTRQTIFNDTVKLHETNLARDSKICSLHEVELRLPFATYETAKFALSLPLSLKIAPEVDTLRKLVLRQVAQNLGLSQFVVEKPKKAIQYTTGTNKALKRIARRNGLTMSEYLHTLFQSTRKKMMQHE